MKLIQNDVPSCRASGGEGQSVVLLSLVQLFAANYYSFVADAAMLLLCSRLPYGAEWLILGNLQRGMRKKNLPAWANKITGTAPLSAVERPKISRQKAKYS